MSSRARQCAAAVFILPRPAHAAAPHHCSLLVLLLLDDPDDPLYALGRRARRQRMRTAVLGSGPGSVEAAADWSLVIGRAGATSAGSSCCNESAWSGRRPAVELLPSTSHPLPSPRPTLAVALARDRTHAAHRPPGTSSSRPRDRPSVDSTRSPARARPVSPRPSWQPPRLPLHIGPTQPPSPSKHGPGPRSSALDGHPRDEEAPDADPAAAHQPPRVRVLSSRPQDEPSRPSC